MGFYARLLLPAVVLAASLGSQLADAQQAARPANAPAMTHATMRSQGSKITEPGTPNGPARPSPIEPLTWPDDSLTLANLGHSTLLMNYFGTRIIADPVFSDKIGVSLGRWLTLGPRRVAPVALKPNTLGPLDAILITHAHMDHLNLPSLARLPKRAAVIACRRCADLIRPLGFADVRELNWGETTTVGGLKVSAFGARHWGRRLPWGQDRGFNSYVLEKRGARVLVACDSAYTPMFRELAPLQLELAAFSIGAYDPWIANHADPEQVWKMFEDSGARYLLPIHWGTFRLSKEPLGEPLSRLTQAAGAQRWRIVGANLGEPWPLPRLAPAPSQAGDGRAGLRAPGAQH